MIELGYPDSGHIADQPAHDTGEALSDRPIQPLIDQMARIMHTYRPDVIVTCPPNGLSGTPITSALTTWSATLTDASSGPQTVSIEAPTRARRTGNPALPRRPL